MKQQKHCFSAVLLCVFGQVNDASVVYYLLMCYHSYTKEMTT